MGISSFWDVESENGQADRYNKHRIALLFSFRREFVFWRKSTFF